MAHEHLQALNLVIVHVLGCAIGNASSRAKSIGASYSSTGKRMVSEGDSGNTVVVALIEPLPSTTSTAPAASLLLRILSLILRLFCRIRPSARCLCWCCCSSTSPSSSLRGEALRFVVVLLVTISTLTLQRVVRSASCSSGIASHTTTCVMPVEATVRLRKAYPVGLKGGVLTLLCLTFPPLSPFSAGTRGTDELG